MCKTPDLARELSGVFDPPRSTDVGRSRRVTSGGTATAVVDDALAGRRRPTAARIEAAIRQAAVVRTLAATATTANSPRGDPDNATVVVASGPPGVASGGGSPWLPHALQAATARTAR